MWSRRPVFAMDREVADFMLGTWEIADPFADQNYVAPNPNMVDRILNSWEKANPFEDEDEFEPEL